MGQAQGTHNAAEEATKLEPPDRALLEENSGRTYWDAPLTPKGQAQAAALRRSLQAERRLSPPAAASGGADGAAVPRLELFSRWASVLFVRIGDGFDVCVVWVCVRLVYRNFQRYL